MAQISRRDFVQSGVAAGLGVGAAAAVRGSQATGTDPPKNPWLVMLFLAGDNNLTESMVLALQDLIAEGPPEGDRNRSAV